MLLGAVLMLVLSIALGWAPPLGPFVAGAVGAYFCGNFRRALLAALLPSILLGLFLYWWFSMEHGPGGFIVAVGLFPVAVADEIGLWAGVIIGAVIARRRRARQVESLTH